jgi:long-subunit fatty acid transport protein
MNSTIHQHESKVLDNQNYKNQESMTQTIHKYNEDRTHTAPNFYKKSKMKDKCVIF